MSREVRRVPVDFDWPTNKVWEGYLTPERLYENPCPDCHRMGPRGEKQYGSGSTPAGMWLDGWLHLLGMMAEDVSDQRRDDGVPVTQRVTGAGGTDRMHPYLQDLMRICIYEHRRPSADIVALVQGLRGERGLVSFGYSSDVAYAVAKVLKQAAGVPDDWGRCPTCEGHGAVEVYPGQRAEAEAYHEADHSPPTGEGWQIWETVSEGSPISPVFPDRQGVIDWLMSPAYTWGTSRPLTRPQAEAFVDAGHSVGSGVLVGGELIPGDAAVHVLAERAK